MPDSSQTVKRRQTYRKVKSDLAVLPRDIDEEARLLVREHFVRQGRRLHTRHEQGESAQERH